VFFVYWYWLRRTKQVTSHSQIGQDLAVLKYYKNKKNGYFVEIGAWDGISYSNTFLMEKLGWDGICVEPLPKLYNQLEKNRKCKTYQCAVDTVGGKTLNFVDAGMLSGDLSRIDKDRISRELGAEKLELQSTIEVQTRNLTDILKDADAPKFIEFLSLDTEGSEFDILIGLDHDSYKFGYITVEHNYKEPNRRKIREFLISKGYTFYKENQFDDDYIYLEFRKDS
jgi:FkbM family methyltransferase